MPGMMCDNSSPQMFLDMLTRADARTSIPGDVPEGLFPVFVDPETGRFTNSLVTFGGLGDSFYEILLKLWVQSGGDDPQGVRGPRDGVWEWTKSKQANMTLPPMRTHAWPGAVAEGLRYRSLYDQSIRLTGCMTLSLTTRC
eukprot:gene5833-1040_t